MRKLYIVIAAICLLTACKKEELPDAEPVAIIDESVTLNIHAKSVNSSGVLSPLLGNTIRLYLSSEDRAMSDNIYYEATTNTDGTATFTQVQIGDHIYLESITTAGDREVDDFLLGNILIKNVEILH